MMRGFQWVAGVGLVWALTSACSGTRQYVPLVDPASPVSPDKARLYVVRPYKYTGSALEIDIRDSGKGIGLLGTGGYLCWEREPGKCIITSQKAEAPEMEAKAGEAYYFEAHITGGLVGFGEQIVTTSSNDALTLVHKAKPPIR